MIRCIRGRPCVSSCYQRRMSPVSSMQRLKKSLHQSIVQAPLKPIRSFRMFSSFQHCFNRVPLDTANISKEIKPLWLSSLLKKQSGMPITQAYQQIYSQEPTIFDNAQNNSSIQQFLSYILINNNNGTDPVNMFNNFTIPKLTSSVESAFIIILHTIIKSAYIEYSNDYLDLYLNKLSQELNLKPTELFISEEVEKKCLFKEALERSDFQIALQILQTRLHETYGWTKNREARHDNIITWINTLFEPSTTQCLISLTKSKSIPDIIAYDLLQRRISNELEYKYYFELYRNHSSELNLLDQEKLYHLKQYDTKYNRFLNIPTLFNNLFQFALRRNIEDLPLLIDLFLNENNISSEHSLQQISELIWHLSYDHTGEYMSKPSRYYHISHSKLVRAVNKMTESNKSLELDVTTMLGVSNLTYYRNHSNSIRMFKNAKKQFSHWQLSAFKSSEFKSVTPRSSNNKIENGELLHNIKIDNNIKFLCNSIMLLAVSNENKDVIGKDLSNIFKKIEPEILMKYPEVWEFVIIKMKYHGLINEKMIGMIFQEYLKFNSSYNINNYFVLDAIINNTGKSENLFSLIENLGLDKMDDNNIAHIISKFYKFAKNNSHKSESEACLEKARELYQMQQFKSTRVNASYLLGESIFSPESTFERYNSISAYFKTTQISISSLFVSVYKLHELGIYNSTLWNEQKPLSFAMSEFDQKISKSYGDTADGLLYPNDNLLTIYIQVMKVFGKNKELHALLDRLVNLKYPLGIQLFSVYLESLNEFDRNELIRCLNAYDVRFQKLSECRSEYDLRRVKARLPKVAASGSFEGFVRNLDMNWDIVRRWNWPGRKT